MNTQTDAMRRQPWFVFGAAFLVAMLFAALTQHVWEDYYITYRSSKNLVAGHGLVFNQGDRLHTFTSPLGVLLPAAALAVTGNTSDAGALWVFRVWSCLAFAGAAMLVSAVAQRLRYGTVAMIALVGFVTLDGKSLDFTINGMETGFLLLFVAYAIWAMFACRRRQWQHLGLAWAGLMWTRPDSFLYVGLLSAGAFFFNDEGRTGATRRQWIEIFLKAGALCTALYLPWILWAWWYYGTPIPNTITAKGGVTTEAKTWLGVLRTFLDFPWSVWNGGTSLESTFLPSYFQIGGWPSAVVTTARWVALVLTFQWVLPWWRVEVRAVSFAFCGMHVYLSYFPFFPFPWYLPGPALLAAVALGGMFAQLISGAKRARTARPTAIWPRVGGVVLVAAVVAGVGAQAWLTWQMKRQVAAEQTFTATAVRQQVGEWLKSNAKPTDTVFMEPLGHIGYFSGLKTYDFPGLSSREMVEAVQVVGTNWANLVEYLSPDWLVLRPHEYIRMEAALHRLFGDEYSYKLMKEFNNLPAIRRLEVFGRNYVEFDAHFLVFKRQVPRRYRLDPTVQFPFEALGVPVKYVDGQRMYVVHATGLLSLRVPPGATHFRIAYAMPKPTYDAAVKTDGVGFEIRWADGRKSEKLFLRWLKPQLAESDRGVQTFDTKLPPHGDNATIILKTLSGPGDGMDWSSWGPPEFK